MLLLLLWLAPVVGTLSASSLVPTQIPSAGTTIVTIRGVGLSASDQIILIPSVPGSSCLPNAAMVAGASATYVSAGSALPVKSRWAVAPGSIAVGPYLVCMSFGGDGNYARQVTKRRE